MMKLNRWMKDFFNPRTFNDLDLESIGQALGNPTVREIWLMGILTDLKQMNKDVDRRLLSGNDFRLTDLCARRKAYQDILEAIASARRQVMQEVRPNPTVPVDINLDRVTA